MKGKLLLSITLISIVTLGQDATRTYLDEFGFTTDKSTAETYCVIVQHPYDANKFMASEYYMNDTIKCTSTYLDKQMYNQDGLFQSFYPNGKKREEGVYKDNNRVGKWMGWYPNGQVKEEYIFDNTKEYYQRLKVMSYWDSLGNQLVSNGNGEYIMEDEDVSYTKGKLENGLRNGVWVGYNEEGRIVFKEEYDLNKLIKGISYDAGGKEYHYDKLLNSNNMVSFYKFVGKNIRYPPTARRKGIEGRVFVKMLFGTDGQILKTMVVKGIGGGCDEEALKIINEYRGKWNTVEKRGQVLQLKKPKVMILPISFKLG